MTAQTSAADGRLEQGDRALLDTPLAQELLTTKATAHLAYQWLDGTPRCVPMWFGWDGEHVVMATPPDAPKVAALPSGTQVALTIDTDTPPFRVLMIRGPVQVDLVDGVVPEYARAARVVMGPQGGAQWEETVRTLSPQSLRIALTPQWVGVLDFETRFPSAIEHAMARAATNAASG